MANAAATVTLHELPPPTLVNLRGGAEDPALAAAATAVLGVAPPTTANSVAKSGELDLLWLGPDEWLAVAPTGLDLAQRLGTALQGMHHSACDVSESRVVLEIIGPEARDVLAQGMSLDLHPRAFGPGRCAQTVLARVPVILQQIDDDPRFRLFVRTSFAPYIREWLKIAIAGAASAA
jgi:sarcosine oxidase, subunit gamma